MDLKNFDKISDELTALSIEEALKLIKKNLNSLGVKHDNFISEKKLVLNNEVEKVVDFLHENIQGSMKILFLNENHISQ